MSAALIRAARARQRITQEQLGLRADVPPELVAEVERGAREPDDELLERLFLVMGEEPVREAGRLVGSRRVPGDWDPLHMAEELRKTPSERLAGALVWNEQADEIYLAFKRERDREGERTR
jgi:transcriptional regulator with XRE-family HTH domain